MSPCGSARLSLTCAEVMLRASGALWLEAARTLVAADLHFEKGSAFAARGQMLPPYDTAETLRRLEAEVAALCPVRIVLLGDSFHDGRGELRMAAGCVERVQALARDRELVWVTGNHDHEGPSTLPGEVVAEADVFDLALRHEPHPGAANEAAGHLHPAARISARGGSVRRRCFITDGRRIVLPAFGAYAGGLNVRDAAFMGLFARKPLVVALGAERVYPVGWGTLAGG